MLLLALACAPVEPVSFCEGDVSYLYNPDPDVVMTTFPDDHWTVPDASTSTGLRVHMDPRTMPAFAAQPEGYWNWLDEISTLDGFGTTAGIVLRFDFAFDVTQITDDRVHLAALTPGGVVRYTPEITFTDYDRTVLLKPRVPLPPGTQVVAVITNNDDTDCLSPSRALRDLLDPEGREIVPPTLSGRFTDGLAALDIDPADVAAMTVFTTQSAHEQSLQVAQDVAGRDYDLPVDDCVVGETKRTCDGTIEVIDYRGSDRVVPPGPIQERDRYTLPVRMWLPAADGAHPVVVCGHGLGGDRDQCGTIADYATANGLALVAIDAVEHGDHPGRTELDLEVLAPLAIFAIQVDPPGLYGLRLRDNFRQSAWDKLQLIQALLGGVDVDGDGQVDLDPDRIGYAGVSLGAIMGPELLALSDAPVGGWMAVGGGRITQIIQDSPDFGPLITVMAPSELEPGDVARAFPMLQTLVDPGDPMTWGPYVQDNRVLDDGHAPDLYVAAALDDSVVPNSVNELFARSLGAPGVGEEIWPVWGVDFAPGDVQANHESGATVGFVQFSEITEGGSPRTAKHANVHDSDQGLDALLAFFAPVFVDGEPAVVQDPDVQ
jgi:dienelactone hydrolase